ncbi:MAG: hypothetical protein WAX38_02360 [Minisyncoccia bacterium]
MIERKKAGTTLGKIFRAGFLAAWMLGVPTAGVYANSPTEEGAPSSQKETPQLLMRKVARVVNEVLGGWDKACYGKNVLSVTVAQKYPAYIEAEKLAKTVVAPFLEDDNYATSHQLAQKFSEASPEQRLLMQSEMRTFITAGERLIALRASEPEVVCALRNS